MASSRSLRASSRRNGEYAEPYLGSTTAFAESIAATVRSSRRKVSRDTPATYDDEPRPWSGDMDTYAEPHVKARRTSRARTPSLAVPEQKIQRGSIDIYAILGTLFSLQVDCVTRPWRILHTIFRICRSHLLIFGLIGLSYVVLCYRDLVFDLGITPSISTPVVGRWMCAPTRPRDSVSDLIETVRLFDKVLDVSPTRDLQSIIKEVDKTTRELYFAAIDGAYHLSYGHELREVCDVAHKIMSPRLEWEYLEIYVESDQRYTVDQLQDFVGDVKDFRAAVLKRNAITRLSVAFTRRVMPSFIQLLTLEGLLAYKHQHRAGYRHDNAVEVIGRSFQVIEDFERLGEALSNVTKTLELQEVDMSIGHLCNRHLMWANYDRPAWNQRSIRGFCEDPKGPHMIKLCCKTPEWYKQRFNYLLKVDIVRVKTFIEGDFRRAWADFSHHLDEVLSGVQEQQRSTPPQDLGDSAKLYKDLVRDLRRKWKKQEAVYKRYNDERFGPIVL